VSLARARSAARARCQPPYRTAPYPSLNTCLSCPPLLSPPHPLSQRKGHWRPLFDSHVCDTSPCPSNTTNHVVEHPIPFFCVTGDRSRSSMLGFAKRLPPPPCHGELLPTSHASPNRLTPHPSNLLQAVRPPPEAPTTAGAPPPLSDTVVHLSNPVNNS
jgi:hypothetical protein